MPVKGTFIDRLKAGDLRTWGALTLAVSVIVTLVSIARSL
jgi:hypothetical protein